MLLAIDLGSFLGFAGICTVVSFIAGAGAVWGANSEWKNNVNERLKEMETNQAAYKAELDELAQRLGGNLISLGEKTAACGKYIEEMNEEIKTTTLDFQKNILELWKKNNQ